MSDVLSLVPMNCGFSSVCFPKSLTVSPIHPSAYPLCVFSVFLIYICTAPCPYCLSHAVSVLSNFPLK